MLKEILDLVKGSALNNVINNADVPNEKNNDVIAEATNTITSGLRNVVAGGGLGSIISMFQGGQGGGKSSSLLNNPLVQMMIGHFAGKLMNKFNMGSQQANHVAGSLIPDALNNLIDKSNSQDDNGFSLEKLLGSITGGKSDELIQQSGGNAGGFFDNILGSLQGGGSGGGIGDILSQLSGGAQQQQQKNGGGGLMDLISGFLK